MNEAISRLVSGALGQNPAGQLACAERILQFLDSNSVRTEFLPFFLSWSAPDFHAGFGCHHPVDERHQVDCSDSVLAIDHSGISDSVEDSLHSLTKFAVGSIIEQWWWRSELTLKEQLRINLKYNLIFRSGSALLGRCNCLSRR
jgi:hypothetical protein